jgi:hypothetical protein
MSAPLAAILIIIARSASSRADLVAWVERHRHVIARTGDLSEGVLDRARARFRELPQEVPA